MSKSEGYEGSGMLSAGSSLNQDLVRQLQELASEEHTSSDCWGSAKPMVAEAVVWILAALVLWGATLSLVV